MYGNFTEALVQLFEIGDSILEIGPGIYIAPTISILQNIRPKSYVAVDGALHSEDSFEKFNQIGGLQEYSRKILNFFGYLPHNLLPVCSLAHSLPLSSKSVQNVLFVKTLSKLTDGILNYWEGAKKSVIEEYKRRGINNLEEKEYKTLSILTYSLLVLDEARRVGIKNIVIIPESAYIEEETLNELKIYSDLTKSDLYVLDVKNPTWKIEEDGKIVEVGHWQDNLVRKLVCLKIKNSAPMGKEEIVRYLKGIYKDESYKRTVFRSLYEKLLYAGEA